YRPPYDWTHVRDFLAARAIPGVERVDERGYARTVACEGGHALICVRALSGEDALELRVTGAPPASLLQLASVARRAFDLAAAPEELAAAMAALPGIGPWTAQYVALRALGEPDALPTGDLVLRRMAAPPGRGSLTTRELDERSREWRPWRGYAVVHLWGAAAGAAARLRQVPSGRARVRRAAEHSLA